MQPTPTSDEIQAALDAAVAAVKHASKMRAKHRGHRRLNRRDDLEPAMRGLKTAAAEVRRLNGMAFAHEFDLDDSRRLLRMSRILQYERRALRKMIAASPGSPRPEYQ